MHVNVAIVGLDRISTSVGLALKRYQGQPKADHSFTIIGSDSLGSSMKTAQRLGAVDNFHRALLKATENADLVIVNPAVSALEDTYTRLGPTLKPGAVVLDLAPLKQPSIRWADQFFPKNAQGTILAYLVGMTPIINAEYLYNADFTPEAAHAALFDGAEVLLTPDLKCPSEAISLAEDIVRLLGGKARFMDPAEHDGLMAAADQLPSLLGVVLFYSLRQSEGWPELRRMVNPPLALMIQNLRNQSPSDLYSLFTGNRENLVRHLESLIGSLDQMRDLLADAEDPEQEKLSALLGMIQKDWEKWDVKRFSGKWEDVKDVHDMEPLPGPFGTLGAFLSPTRRKRGRDEDDED